MLDIQPVTKDDGLESTDTSKGIALIDADTIAYTSCLEMEIAEECLPFEFYNEEEWEDIINHPGYHEETHTIYTTDLDLILNTAKERIEKIRYMTNSKSVELYFSSGMNFRHKLKDTYKANRKSMRYPEGLAWVKAELVKIYSGEVCTEWEADDAVVYLKRKFPKEYTLCAIDKDVLNSVPGKHFDYYHKREHFVETDIETATKWPYIQCLMGDTSDNIPGLKGIGPKKAEKAFGDCVLPCDLWNVVVNLYTERGETIKHAIETMRLVWMHGITEDRNGNWKIQLWEPPCDVQ